MSGLLELAERCEAATGPDREIDLTLFQRETGKPFRWAEFGSAFSKLEGDDLVLAVEILPFDGTEQQDRVVLAREREIVRVPAYTASLDAALLLVPEGFSFQLGRGWRCDIKDGRAWASIIDKQYGPPSIATESENAATPALALCAAALRARAAGESA